MPYYKLVLRESAAPAVLMGAKECICTAEQREALEEKWRVAEERCEIELFPWERKFYIARVIGTAAVHFDDFRYEHADIWEHTYPLEMAALDAQHVYVAANDGSFERYVCVQMRELKQNRNLLFPNPRTAVIPGDRDLVAMTSSEIDSENRTHFTNIISSTVYFYETAFPNEAAARRDMEQPCAVNLRTFFDEIFGNDEN